jgi:hypothetical protein
MVYLNMFATLSYEEKPTNVRRPAVAHYTTSQEPGRGISVRTDGTERALPAAPGV